MSENGKQTAKDAALIALRRAEQEATTEGNLLVVGALIVTAIRQVQQIEELKRARKPKAAKVTATP